MTHKEKEIRKLQTKIVKLKKIEAKEKKFKPKPFRAGFETSLKERRIKA